MESNYIAELIDAGADAMTNMYEVTFNLAGLFEPGITNKFKVRVSGFTPPEPKIAVYDVHYKTVSMKQRATKVELERKLTFSFRVDAYYDVYKALRYYQNTHCNPSKGYAANGSDPAIGVSSITVKALDEPLLDDTSEADTRINRSDMAWTFTYPWIESLKLDDFGTDDAKQQKVTATFYYADYSEPAS